MKIFFHCDMDGRAAGSIVAAARLWHIKQISDNGQGLSLSEEDKKLLGEYETRSVFIECDYSSKRVDPSLVADGEEVIIVDLSFSFNTFSDLEEILAKASHVTWIDHHVSSCRVKERYDLSKYPNLTSIIGDNSVSGAYLTWTHYFGIRVPKFIEFISDYDCWLNKLPQSMQFKYGMDMSDHNVDSQTWKDLISDGIVSVGSECRFDLENHEDTRILYRILNEGSIAKRYMECYANEYYNSYHFTSTIFGPEAVCVNWKTNSVVFGKEYYNYPLCCVFAYNGDVWTYSLYSHDENIDCSVIAEQYGGGGHKGAAGFSTEHCLFDLT